MSGNGRTWVEIDLDAVRNNLGRIRAELGGTPVIAVVKADAYGHGAVPVAKAALEAGAAWLGVALVTEGVQLRQRGITAPILVLAGMAPEEAEEAVRADLSVTVASPEAGEALSQAVKRVGGTARVHLKVDTGMGRLGARGPREAMELAAWLKVLPGVVLEGVFTHLATADSDVVFAREQLTRFQEVLTAMEREGCRPPLAHAANSAAALGLPEARFDLVRVGIAMYGLAPTGTGPRPEGLNPALTWKAKVSFVKRVPAGTPVSYGCTWVAPEEGVIATLPLGYADGYPRHLSNRGEVLLAGHRCPVAGRICMDQFMIGAFPGAQVGQEAVLIGRQEGQEITAEAVAAAAQTINYEITTRIGVRVPRVYKGARA